MGGNCKPGRFNVLYLFKWIKLDWKIPTLNSCLFAFKLRWLKKRRGEPSLWIVSVTKWSFSAGQLTRVVPVPLHRCLCPAPRCSTAPSTAGRSPSAGAGVPPSPGSRPCPSGCVSAPPHLGAYAGSWWHRTPWSPAAPSRSPWCSDGPPPSLWRTGGTWTETSWWRWCRGVHLKQEREKVQWTGEQRNLLL